MNARLYDQWLEATFFAPVARWQEIAAETAQKHVQLNFTAGKDYIEYGTRQWQLLSEIKDPQKWASEVSKTSAEFSQKCVDHVGDFLKVTRETQEAISKWTKETAQSTAETCNAARKTG